ncbi:MAG TPA: uracil-DNA glycosylase [Nitrospirota bacterium]
MSTEARNTGHTQDPRAHLAEYLEFMRDSGMTERWGRGSFRWAGGAGRHEAELPGDAGAAPSATDIPAPSFSTLEEVREYLGECTRCGLSEGRTNIVFGAGNPNAKLMFVGEGPGADEDIKGEPFVGRAGQLLTDIIEKGMLLKRSDVYIANVVKCRPPGNRDPLEDEIAACEPFLLHQLDVIKPKIICALGKFAAQTLLKTTEKISSLRGNVYEYHGIKLVPTFHPSYLLRNPADKKLAWVDVQKIMALYKEL